MFPTRDAALNFVLIGIDKRAYTCILCAYYFQIEWTSDMRPLLYVWNSELSLVDRDNRCADFVFAVLRSIKTILIHREILRLSVYVFRSRICCNK